MFEVRGKYANALIFTDTADESSIAQVQQLCNQEFASGSRIRMMPDIHAGKGCTVGTTMTITNKVVPNLVGVDIGCGMETVCLNESELDFARLDECIRRKIPSGFAIRKKPHALASQTEISKLRCIKHVDIKRALLSVGSLGGGNHFIEVAADDDGLLFLIVHSGSRHLGVEVAEWYQQEAYRRLNGSDSISASVLVAKLKAAGRHNEIERELAKLRNTKTTAVPKDMAYAEGALFDDYIHDMRLVQRYAALNRQAMVSEILQEMGLTAKEQLTTIHNYIDTDSMILRKGAVAARAGEKLLIPINMRDGSLLCEGLGNEDWNFSAPHGAGRLMSRSQAKKTFSLKEFESQMQNVFTTSVCNGTLDECPMAYKDMQSILDNITPTVKVLKRLYSRYNFKASDGA